LISSISSMPGVFYLWWSGIEEYWMPNDIYMDASAGSLDDRTTETRSMSITQKLMAHDQIIETLVSALTYTYELIDSASGEQMWSFVNESHLPLFVAGHYETPAGAAERSEVSSAKMGRNVSCVEVLDFDSMQGLPQGDLFIVFYKKISIVHSQTNSSSRSSASAPTGVSRECFHFPFPPLAPAWDESFLVSGTRKVEYYIAYKIGDADLQKVKLAEFNSSVSGNEAALVHSGSGERLWGVSCQLNEDLIVYHFQKDEYKNNGTAAGNDSPMNFEDISYQGTTKLWDPKKIVVGVINVGHEKAQEAGLDHERFEFDPAPSELIYSVGLHRKPKEVFQEEEVA